MLAFSQDFSVHLLHVDRGAGEDGLAIQDVDQLLAVAVDEAHPESGKAEVLAESPHEVGAGGVRQLEGAGSPQGGTQSSPRSLGY